MASVASLFFVLLIARPFSLWAQTDWQEKWKKIVAESKRESTVIVAASSSPQTRLELEQAFSKGFGFRLEYLGLAGAESTARVEREAAAGKATIDVLLSGNTELLNLLPAGRLAPVRDKLTLPEVLEGTNWRNRSLRFNDPEGQYLLQTMEFVPADLVINRSALNDKITSWKDLLKPEYKGKIATFEPRSGGQGQQHAAYLLKLFGPDYIKDLYVGQKVVYTGDRRQLGDWIARGTYPIVMAIATREIEEARRLGIAIERVFPGDGPGVLVGASGVIKLVRNAPHPNAASVFLNWFLTKEVQEIFQRTNAMLSRRTDVDMSGIPDYIVPKQGVKYEDFYTYAATVEFFPKARKMLEELLGGR